MSDSIALPAQDAQDWRHGAKHFVSGTIAGAVGVFVGHPLDLVKVRLQTQTPVNGVLPYRGTIHCLSTIVRSEGPRALFKGMTSPMLGDSSTNAIVFGAYGGLQRLFLDDGQTDADFDRLSLWAIALAGAATGLIAGAIIAPVELIKVRLQIQKSAHRREFTSPWNAVAAIYRTYGVRRGLLLGLGATWVRDIPSFAAYFVLYEGSRRWLCRDGERVAELSPVRTMVAGGIGGVVSWIVIYLIVTGKQIGRAHV